jgi:hypothetical protein
VKQPGRDADVRHGYPPTDTDRCGDRFNQQLAAANGTDQAWPAPQPGPLRFS